MPSHRAKKGQGKRSKLKVQSDFQKRKKKLGKGKQVPENATRISFKSKSIVVPTQLEDSAIEGPTTHRKQSLQVLLTQIKHYNLSIRHDALIGLKEILQRYPELITPNLPRLIEQIFSTMVDASALVRQASHALIKTLMHLLSNDLIRPFFQTVVAHMNCGLTHISEKIQLDSLKVLEIYLQCYPNLLVKHIGEILPILIGLLSRQRISGSDPRTECKKKKKRLLSIVQKARSVSTTSLVTNPDSKLVSKNSRRDVFGMISKLLDITYQSSIATTFVSDAFQNKGKFNLLEALVSVLKESWMECNPSDILYSKSPPIQYLMIMEDIIHILNTLLKLILRVLPTTEEEQERLSIADVCDTIYSDNIMPMASNFPFMIIAHSSQVQFKQMEYDMNLAFCHVVLLLKSLVKGSVDDTCVHSVLKYLGELNSEDVMYITSSSQILQTCSSVFIGLIPLLCELSHKGIVQDEVLMGAFQSIRNFYEACHPQSKSVQLLVKCFSEIFIGELAKGDHGCSCLAMRELFLPWCNTLVNLFMELVDSSPDTSLTVIDSIARAALYGNMTILSILQGRLLTLFSPTVTFLSKLPELTQRKVVELIWHLPSLKGIDLTLLSRCVLSGEFSLRVMLYMVQIIHQKFMRESSAESTLSCISPYLSFMLTLLVGYNKDQTPSRPDAGIDQDTNQSWIAVTQKHNLNICAEDYIEIHKIVCECLMSSSISSCVLLCLEKALLELMIPRFMPINTIAGILELGCRFGPLSDVSSDLISFYGGLCLSSLLTASSLTNHSLDHQLIQHCLRLSHQMLKTLKPLLVTVMASFRNLILFFESTSDCIIKCAMEVLTCPDLYQMLWNCRQELREPLQDIMDFLVRRNFSTVGVCKELELCIGKLLVE